MFKKNTNEMLKIIFYAYNTGFKKENIANLDTYSSVLYKIVCSLSMQNRLGA